MANRKNEWLRGRKVRLLRDMETRGGTQFPKGIVCYVDSVYRGELSLSARNPDPNNIFGPRFISIRCDFAPWRMEVLPDDRPRCPWGCKHFSKSHDETTEGCAEKNCECRWFRGTTEVDPERLAADEEEEALDSYHLSGREEDQPTKAECTHPDDLPEDESASCDCGKVRLTQKAGERLEPYAKVVKVSGIPTAIKHAVTGCHKVDHLGLSVMKIKSKSR